MMWTVILCSLVLTMAHSQILTQDRQLIGTCDEECSNNILIRALGSGSCPVGYVCKSNGCGHSCQKETRAVFGICVELCDDGCADGYECRSNGCGHTCQPVLP